MKLYKLFYGGMLGIDEDRIEANLLSDMCDKITSRFMSKVTEQNKIYVDHPSDLENMINWLDDWQIPCVNHYDSISGVSLGVLFVLKEVDARNKDVVAFIETIDSTKGN